MKAEDFKNVLRSYRWIERKIQELYYKIAEKEHELTGLGSHGIKLTAEQERSGKPMPRYSGGGRSLVDRICEVDELKKEYEGLKKLKASVDVVLDRMQEEDRNMIIAYYCDRKSIEKIVVEYGYSSRSPLYRKMNAVIKQSVK